MVRPRARVLGFQAVLAAASVYESPLEVLGLDEIRSTTPVLIKSCAAPYSPRGNEADANLTSDR